MKQTMQLPSGLTLASLAPRSIVRDTSEAAASKIASTFADLAGSAENTLLLAHALHDGVAAHLAFETDTGSTVTVIDAPPLKMGWNDVKMALMLARDALHRYGISHPTAPQLKAVLAGGDVAAPNGKTLAFRGVLHMRAQGLNWGQIAAERYRRPAIANNGNLARY